MSLARSELGGGSRRLESRSPHEISLQQALSTLRRTAHLPTCVGQSGLQACRLAGRLAGLDRLSETVSDVVGHRPGDGRHTASYVPGRCTYVCHHSDGLEGEPHRYLDTYLVST